MYVIISILAMFTSMESLFTLLTLLVILVQFNFIGRLLGPRGNSLKRIEASTGCRVFIRGKGSIKDPGKVNIILVWNLTLEPCRYIHIFQSEFRCFI